MDSEKYEEAVRDYEKITKMDHNHGKKKIKNDFIFIWKLLHSFHWLWCPNVLILRFPFFIMKYILDLLSLWVKLVCPTYNIYSTIHAILNFPFCMWKGDFLFLKIFIGWNSFFQNEYWHVWRRSFHLWMFTQDSLFSSNELLSTRVLPSLRNTYKRAWWN